MDFYRKVLAVHKETRKEKTRGGVLLCGYYGFFNVGDDALLAAAIARAREKFPCFGVSALTRRGKRDAWRWGIPCVRRDRPLAVMRAIRRAEVVVFGGGTLLQDASLALEMGSEPMTERPIVVGFGPGGMFAALLLAENGYRPVLIDRGASVSERVEEVERFYRDKKLNPATNIQFGAGGAGTFSDGKLVTRINDPNCNYVLRKLCEFGAPDDVLTKAKPHVGTDILRDVVTNILNKIEELGGTLMYKCRLDGIRRGAGNSVIASTTQGDISCGALVLALGHSARDTYAMLMNSGFSLLPKPFSVGVRVEHLQSNIDRAMYGNEAGNPLLGHAEYSLSYTKGARGVYTFCMCPGGEVVAAASEEGGVVVNGMSRYARDGVNANAAVAVSVRPEAFGNDVTRAIAFQRSLEQSAYALGGGNYTAPIQTLGDFMQGVVSHEPSSVLPSYMNGNCRVADLTRVLPDFVAEELRTGFSAFDRQISGFADREAILTAVETRTSAPLTIGRTKALTAMNDDLIYPCGEGAGYAGGITSAAVDGIRVALEIMGRFSAKTLR